MLCREAQRVLLDLELSPGEVPAGAELRAHLAACPHCSARAAAERRLSGLLRGLRFEAPPPVDVTARVLEGLPALRPAGDAEVSTRQLGWGATLALTCSLALLATLWRMLPGLSGPAREIWTLALGLRHPLESMGSVVMTLLSAILKTAGRMLQALAPLAQALQGLEPVAIGALAFCVTVMAGTIVFVVGRDLRTRASSEKGGTI